ncbi:Ribokinase-like protein [Paraphysoderma sedebokerense]|nr:Ribokinase-like protein [Paraphysoderma sedebokerense]
MNIADKDSSISKDAPLLVVGHYSHDSLILQDGTTVSALGGSVGFISTILSALSIPCRVVSKVGKDFDYHDRTKPKYLQPLVVSDQHTTHFVSDFYTPTLSSSASDSIERIESVKHTCSSILPEDIPCPSSVRDGKFPISLAVGIVGEIPSSTITSLSQRSNHLLADIQGLIRYVDKAQNKLIHKNLADTEFHSCLESLSWLKISSSELKYVNLELLRARTNVLVTRGGKGATAYLKSGETIHVMGYHVSDEVDPTGCGDCFLAGFAAGLYREFPLQDCIRLGHFFGATALRTVGIPRISPKYAEMAWDYIKTNKTELPPLELECAKLTNGLDKKSTEDLRGRTGENGDRECRNVVV